MLLLENIIINFFPSFQLPNEQRKPHLKQGVVVPESHSGHLGKENFSHVVGYDWSVSMKALEPHHTSQPTDHVFLIASAADTFQPVPETVLGFSLFSMTPTLHVHTQTLTPAKGHDTIPWTLQGHAVTANHASKTPKLQWREEVVKCLTWCKSTLKCETHIETTTLHLL